MTDLLSLTSSQTSNGTFKQRFFISIGNVRRYKFLKKLKLQSAHTILTMEKRTQLIREPVLTG